MANPIEWIVDPLERSWEFDLVTNTVEITATSTVRTRIHLDRLQEDGGPFFQHDAPPIPIDQPEALLGQPLGPWDFPPEPLPDFPLEPLHDLPLEPMSPGLPGDEPQPIIPVIEISSTATTQAAAVSPPLPEYHPGADSPSEEDPSEAHSSSASCNPDEAGPSRLRRRIEVISLHPRIIRTPHVPRGRGARRSRVSGPRHL